VIALIETRREPSLVMNSILEPLIAELKVLESPFQTQSGVFRVQVVNLVADDLGDSQIFAQRQDMHLFSTLVSNLGMDLLDMYRVA
jgi:hypothetical protein